MTPKKDETLFILMMIFFIMGLFIALSIATNKAVERQEIACIKRGGEPMVLRSEVICLSPGVLLPETKR